MAGRTHEDPFAELFGALSERLRDDRFRPPLDVWETEAAIRIRMEIAGVSRERLRVTVQGEELRIHGERTPPAEGAVLRHHQMEIPFGPFERVIRVGVPFDRDGVVAHLSEGFLTVTLPKRRSGPRRIPVERAEEGGSS